MTEPVDPIKAFEPILEQQKEQRASMFGDAKPPEATQEGEPS